MFTHGGEAAEAAITGRERRFLVQLSVDWEQDGSYDHELSDLSHFVFNVTTDRSLRGSAPEEIMLIEGASAAELTFKIDGEHNGISFTSIFSPYNGLSPLYLLNPIGAEVKYGLGVETALGVVWYPQFVGNIRTITPDRATGTVEFTALDRVEKLRRPVQFPKWAISEYHASRGYVRGQLCDTQWVIDHCLRFADTSPTMYRPTYREEMNVPDDGFDGVHFWLSGTGSHLPTIGWLDNSFVQTFPHTEVTGTEMFSTTGAYHNDSPEKGVTDPLCFSAMGDEEGHLLKYWVDDRDLMRANGTHYYGFTLNLRGPNADYCRTVVNHKVLGVRLGDKRVIRLYIDQGTVIAEREYEPDGTIWRSTPVPIPEGLDWVRVLGIWDNSEQTGTRVFLRVGDNTTDGFEVKGNPWNGETFTDELKGLIEVRHRVSLNDVFYGSRYIYNPSPTPDAGAYRDAKYAAVLDAGRNRFSYLPDRNGNDAWSIITEVAAAEFGSVFWDENGVFRFWNYERMLAKQDEIVRTLSLDEVSDLRITNSLDSVRNIWSVDIKRRVAYGGNVLEVQRPDEFVIPGRTRKIFRIFRDDILYVDPFLLTRYETLNDSAEIPEWHDNVRNGYVVQWDFGGTWREDNSRVGVDITCYYDALGRLVVNIWNGWNETARITHMRVWGTRIEDQDTVTVQKTDRDSVAKYGGRNYKAAGDWYQDQFQTNAMLDTLLARTSKPIPTTDAITIAGDPRLQLGDCIEVRDENGLGERVRLQIYGIRREFDIDKGLTDTLTVEMLEPAGVGIWDSRQYGIWDRTFVWSD